MGYDVWAYGEFTIKADQLKKAIPAIVKVIRDKLPIIYENIFEVITPVFSHSNEITPRISATLKLVPQLIESALDERYSCSIGDLSANTFDDLGNLSIEASGDPARDPDDEIWFFDAIAPFCEPNSLIEFRGEDDFRWRWEIVNSKFEEVGSEVIFGNDVNAPGVVEKIIKSIYHSGDTRQDKPGQPITAFFDSNDPKYEDVVEKIESILRESGFGPQAGKTELERLAEV
jgi:hypothetical protein